MRTLKLAVVSAIVVCLSVLSGCRESANNEDVQKQLEEAQDDLRITELELDRVRQFNAQLKENIDILQEQLDAYRGNDTDNKQLQQKVSNTESEIDGLNSRLNDAITDRNEALEKVAGLQAELEAKNAEIKELNAMIDQSEMTIEQIPEEQLGGEEMMPDEDQPYQQTDEQADESMDEQADQFGEGQEIEEPNIEQEAF